LTPTETPAPGPSNLILPLLPLKDVCLFPGASLALVVNRPAWTTALQIAARTGRRILTVAQRDPVTPSPVARDLYPIGTMAYVREDLAVAPAEHRIELDGLARALVVGVVGMDLMLAEVEPVEEGEAGEEWGPAVEALARYLHTHADLRAFLEEQRRSPEPMGWVNLACQHLPITASARQRLLEANAIERCLKISRGLDALLRKEHGA
jgi:ATP-dependent Lon protease